MPHTAKNKERLLVRIKRIQGQLGAVASSLEKGDECYIVLQRLAGARGALQGLIGEIIEGHIREHVVAAKSAKDASEAGEQTIEIMKSFWR
ncbi:MAG: metal/formaldehyde-sensitive transcriptional repressor [Bdellovibrio sp.]|nr:metal/formaldehyde-sensitive transcriptional repressor [Bdellovibrio sp.]